MKNTAASSTQKFTEVRDIVEDIVVFTNGNACTVIEVKPTNFALLSTEEQDAKIASYASFLNSLSFPIQILAVNKRVDVTSYVVMLDDEIKKITDTRVSSYMENYKNFVLHLVKQNVVLDKKFYMIVPYSSLEKTSLSTSSMHNAISEILIGAKPTLKTKVDGLRSQLTRAGLQTAILQKDQLVDLFHRFYNSINKEDKEEEKK